MELITVREAAALLRVSPVTVRRYIALRRLPAVRVGKGVRVRKEDAEKLPVPVESEPASQRPGRRPRIFTSDDPLWRIVGIGRSEGPTDISENKHEYLAEAYADLHDKE